MTFGPYADCLAGWNMSTSTLGGGASVYVFDLSAGDGTDKDLLGGKGAGLATMTAMGLPVPPGYTLTTEACRRYLAEGNVPKVLWDEVREAGERLESATGRSFGAPVDKMLGARNFTPPNLSD